MSCTKRNTTRFNGTHNPAPVAFYRLVNNPRPYFLYIFLLIVENSTIFIPKFPYFHPCCFYVIPYPVQPRVNVTLKSEGMEPSHYVIRGYGALINPKWVFRRSCAKDAYITSEFSAVFPFNSFVGPRQGECARGHTPMEIFSIKWRKTHFTLHGKAHCVVTSRHSNCSETA